MFGAVVVTLGVKLLELLRVVDAFLDHETTHHAARFFGVKADDFVLAVFKVPEFGVDDARVQG